jgi:ubiquinone/menaquinone biosynthesis C-methylase UbiE
MTEVGARRRSLLQQLIKTGLKVFLWLLYHQLAWCYDAVAALVSLGHWKTWVCSVLPNISGRTLELGHGPGHLQLEMRHRGLWTVGLDESRQMSRLAYRRLRALSIRPLLVNGRAQNLPFADQSFTTVVTTFPTEFIFDPQTLNEIYRVLIPGGSLITLPVAWIDGKGWHERLASWLFRITGQAEAPGDEFYQPLVRAGFRVNVERRRLPASLLLIVFAKKPERD